MPIYKPSELREFLTSLGIAPKKFLSQNFLIDGNILRKIIASAAPSPEDIVLEIGPGPGSLTELLLESGATVVAVEKDPILADALKRLNPPDNRLKIYCEDIRSFSFEESLYPLLGEGKKAQVIANLPYHLTTPILARLLPLHRYFSKLTIMVQNEMAQRMISKPHTSDYSSFTVFLNFFCQARYAFKVGCHSFYPAPKVDSAVAELILKPAPQVSNQDLFFELTRTAFKQRRKMLRSSLKDLYPAGLITHFLEEIGQNPKARPEELNLDEFIQLFEKLQSST